MTKVKYLILLFMTALLILVFPNIVSAATKYTYIETEQGIEWSYQLDSSENVVNLKCETTSVIGAVTIPSTIDGKTVIALGGTNYIDDGAFRDCKGITAITIPNTIGTIGYEAFYNCTGLKTVTIPDSVTSIGQDAFNGCSGITSITLSQNLSSIGNRAFSNCSGLKSLTIPNSVTSIANEAFANCSGLKELTLSENLTKLNDKVFYGCTGLTSVILPDSVTTIVGEYTNIYGAFGDCKNLAKILIPDTVASIGVGAFQGCDKLTIYGNDGMESKEYAEEHGIPFDYIANWDKADSGTDITAPTVEGLKITYQSVLKYNQDSNTGMYMVPAEAKLTINASFSEPIKGTTVPTLTIKFGDGKNIEVKEGTIVGSTITYVYTIKSTDKGTMTAVSLAGGDIKDEAGNSAILSCPELKVEFGGLVYANGTATNPGSGDNNGTGNGNGTGTGNNNGTGNGNGTGTGNNNGTGNGNGTGAGTQDKKDPTTAPGEIPKAGLEIGIVIIIIGVIIASAVVYSRYSKMRDIM